MYRINDGDLLVHSVLACTPVLVFIPLVAFIVPVLFRLLKPCQLSELTTEWFESFHISCYQPMQGLLSADDFQFLSRQPGFDPSLFRKLRRDRLRIFRQYLNRLIMDFNRLHTLARLIISQSPEDQSALFTQLLSLRLHFWISIVQVEFSYLLCRISSHSISVRGPIQRLEEMSRHLTSLPQSKTLLAN
jgi:hypothetical protein